jgi:Tol biopolymer transport system component
MTASFQFFALVLLMLSTAFGQDTAYYHGKKLSSGMEPVYCADGKMLAVVQNGHLNLVNLQGKFVRRIDTGNLDSSEPSCSPDGKKIAFASYGPAQLHSNKFAIWIANIDATNLHKLTDPQGDDDQYPAWTRDGTHIIWTHGQSLWIADSSGKNLRPLTHSPDAEARGFFETSATCSPNNKTIAFLRSRDYKAPSLWLIDVDSMNERQLRDIHAYSVKWSNDPHIFFFSTERTVMKFNIDDLSTSCAYTFGKPEVAVGWFSLSPDESHIAYDTSAPEVDPDVMIDRFVCTGQ